jgi:hypothetical protein
MGDMQMQNRIIAGDGLRIVVVDDGQSDRGDGCMGTHLVQR